MALKDRLQPWKGSPKDLAHWLFWVQLRRGLDPAHPERLRTLYPLWRAQYAVARHQKALMRDELRRSFGDVPESVVQDAYRIAFRVHLEELMLGRIQASQVPDYMVFAGREHLDGALERGKGAILLLPHAGNVMMMIAAVSHAGYAYTQYAARGLAPDKVAAANPETFGHNRWREQVREARESGEDRLPASFLTLETSARELYRRLARNQLIGIAFDGRIGNRFLAVPYLGRRALINPGAYRIAARTGAAIVPTLCECPADGPNICRFGEPLTGDDPMDLLDRYVHGAVEPWVRAHPAEYGVWLAHARERAAVDDHPLFVDYAPDERWRRWETRDTRT